MLFFAHRVAAHPHPRMVTHMEHTSVFLPLRHMLAGGVAALAGIGLATFTRGAQAQAAPKPMPAYVSWKDPSNLIVHSNPTIETRRSAFGTSVITPSDQLYIRNNLL